MATAAASSSSSHLLHFLLRPQPSSFVSFLKPLLLSSPTSLSTRLPRPLFHSLPSSPFYTSFSSSSSSSSFTVPHALSPASVVTNSFENSEDNENSNELEDIDDSIEDIEVAEDELESESDSSVSPLERKREERLKLEVPSLSVKERKELASYAHSLGEKLKTQLVGKSGVTSNVATSFIETLEANELLKIKIHRSCPGELDDVVKQLEESTGSVAVGQIGRTVIIYRPSLSRLKAEEKKKHVRNLILKKQKARLRPTSKFSRRGSSPKFRNSRS
ncbi:hypothetical protein RIF29_32346 [Crotalaria pallida]|uniref:CRM domain-containing protein n=1 Tax=Crotalaria pallida TaxID=3830 RepID=A0AAN9I2D6_CROPI